VVDTQVEYRHIRREEQRPESIDLVNFKHPFIFNGVFEMQKSTRNEQKNAEMRAFGTWVRRLYLVRIYHDGRLRETNLLVTRRTKLGLEAQPLELAAVQAGTVLQIPQSPRPEATVRSARNTSPTGGHAEVKTSAKSGSARTGSLDTTISALRKCSPVNRRGLRGDQKVRDLGNGGRLCK
jgi:hypothetical protein